MLSSEGLPARKYDEDQKLSQQHVWSRRLNDSASRSLEKVSLYHQLYYQRMVFVLS